MSSATYFAFMIVAACAMLHSAHAECDIAEVDLDYTALKAACEGDDVCGDCLNHLVDGIFAEQTDTMLEAVVPQLYDPETKEFDNSVLQECAQPYIPTLVKEAVFVPITKALGILNCDPEGVVDKMYEALEPKGLGYLIKSDEDSGDSEDSGEGGDEDTEEGGDEDTEEGGDEDTEEGGDEDTEEGGDEDTEEGGDEDKEEGGD